MKEIIDRIFRNLGYVPHDSLMNEIYEAARHSFRTKKVIVVNNAFYKFRIQVVS